MAHEHAPEIEGWRRERISADFHAYHPDPWRLDGESYCVATGIDAEGRPWARVMHEEGPGDGRTPMGLTYHGDDAVIDACAAARAANDLLLPPASEVLVYRLTDARKATGETQEQLAARLGVAVRTIRGWEGLQASPPWTQLDRWARAVGVSLWAGQTASSPSPPSPASRGSVYGTGSSPRRGGEVTR